MSENLGGLNPIPKLRFKHTLCLKVEERILNTSLLK